MPLQPSHFLTPAAILRISGTSDILPPSSLPGWVRACIPRLFYITEKAWNHFPTTVTEYTVCTASCAWLQPTPVRSLHAALFRHPLQCSFLPRFKVRVTTTYQNDCGDSDEVGRSGTWLTPGEEGGG